VGDAFGNRAQRAGSVQAAAADDDKVGALRRRNQGVRWTFGTVVVVAVGDRGDEPLVDAFAAPGDDGVQFGAETFADVVRGCVGRGRLDRAVDADDDVVREAVAERTGDEGRAG
jgi:hypothetical protein